MVSCDLQCQSLGTLQLCNQTLLPLVELQPAKPCNACKAHCKQVLRVKADLPISAASGRAEIWPGICTLWCLASIFASHLSWLQFGSRAHDRQLRTFVCTWPRRQMQGLAAARAGGAADQQGLVQADSRLEDAVERQGRAHRPVQEQPTHQPHPPPGRAAQDGFRLARGAPTASQAFRPLGFGR